MNIALANIRRTSNERLGVRHKGIRCYWERLIKAISTVVSIEEDRIFTSKEWPYLWDKRY